MWVLVSMFCLVCAYICVCLYSFIISVNHG